MAYSSWLAGTLGVAGCVTCDGRCCECVMGLPPPCMCDGTRAVSLLASEEISRFSLSVQKERKKKNTRYYFSCVRLIDPNNARFPYASAIGWQRGHAHMVCSHAGLPLSSCTGATSHVNHNSTIGQQLVPPFRDEGMDALCDCGAAGSNQWCWN
jgi:hypothetical protein